MIYSVLVSVDVLLAAGLIGLVLVQQGKGANAGAAFGSGASGTVFGSRGSASFLTRATAILAALFFINSIVLAYLASHRPVETSVMETTKQEQTVPPDSEAMQEIKEEIQKQIEEAANQQKSTLPEDVPSLDNRTEQDSMTKDVDALQEQAQEVIDETQEAVQKLPADVPQN